MSSASSQVLKSERISKHILDLIKSGNLSIGSPAPSINQLAKELSVANETVVKAYRRLKERGILNSIPAKGFYIAKTNIDAPHSVFVLLDTMNGYKHVLYNAMVQQFGDKAQLDIYFHHSNFHTFEHLINESNGKYTEYIVLPNIDDCLPVLQRLPKENIYIIDCAISNYSIKGITQDFSNDIYNALSSEVMLCKKYKRISFLYCNDYERILDSITTGLNRFCEENKIAFHKIKSNSIPKPAKGEAYIVVDDEHLVTLVKAAEAQNLKLGIDVGIISYNETSLKSIVSGGISVVTTDFSGMGTVIANMVLSNANNILKNPFKFINRGSF